MKKEKVASMKAPAAIGPYSQAVMVDKQVFVSGQLPVNAATGELVTDITLATKQSLDNIVHILETVGGSVDNIVKTTVFLADLNDFQAMNEMYANYFKGIAPARSTIQVAKLPKDAIVEIEAVAIID